jgi:hypothetical protein
MLEQQRWQNVGDANLTGQRDFMTQLAKDRAAGKVNPAGVNTQFETTRDEQYLRPEDIWGSQDVMTAGGNDYFGKWNEDQRRKYSQGLLDAKLVQEKKGGVYLTDLDKARKMAADISGGVK